jgi:hypothetical protein
MIRYNTVVVWAATYNGRQLLERAWVFVAHCAGTLERVTADDEVSQLVTQSFLSKKELGHHSGNLPHPHLTQFRLSSPPKSPGGCLSLYPVCNGRQV